MSRRTFASALAIVVALVLFARTDFAARMFGEQPQTIERRAETDRLASTDPKAEIEVEPSETRRSALATETEPATNTIVVRGRVTDGFSEPIEGARVVLRALMETAENAPTAPPDGVAPWSFAATSARDGRFELVADARAGAGAVLEVECGWERTKPRIQLADDDRSAHAAPHVGVNDVGAVVLLECGAVEGRVVDLQGEPVAGVVVRLRNDSDEPRFATTRADGDYRFDHICAGPAKVTIHDRVYHEEPNVEDYAVARVAAGALARARDIRVVEAPLVRGVVVDTSGEPVVGAEVRFHSPASGFAVVETDSAGRFECHSYHPTPRAHFKVRHRNHRTRDASGTPPDVTPDGELRIVMEPLRDVELQVVDATSNEPVADYDVTLLQRDEEGFEPDPVVVEVRGARDGVVMLKTRARDRFECTIAAPGRVVRSFTSKLAGERLVVRTAMGGSVVGRVVSNGQPCADRPVELRDPTVNAPERDESVASYFKDPLLFDRLRTTRTDAEGRFEFDGVPSGRWHATAERTFWVESSSATITVDGLGIHDLGDVEVCAPRTVSGRVLLRDDMPRAGIEVLFGLELDDAFQASARTDVEGRFTVVVPAGHMPVELKADPRFDESFLPEWGVDFSEDDLGDVILDVRDAVPMTLDLVVRVSGTPLAGMYVSTVTDERRIETASTDEHGRVQLSARGTAPPTVEVHSDLGAFLGRTELRQAAGRAQWTGIVDVECGSLELRLANEALTRGIDDGSSYMSLPSASHAIGGPWAEAARHLGRFDEHGVLRIEHLATGTWDFVVVHENHEFAFDVVIEASRTVVLTLRP